MVSPVHPSEIHAVTHLALQALELPNDPAKVRTSVIPLPDDMGYAVTVVHFDGSLTVRLLHIDMEGTVLPFGGEA